MSDVIEFDELSANLKNYVVVDVRNPDEVERHGQIPGSHCLPAREVEEALDLDDQSFKDKYGFPKPSPDQTLVTHCMKGGRARRAGDALAAKGLCVKVYAGSFEDWSAKGGKIDPGKPSVSEN